jgi:methyltransferase family protein
VQSCVGDGDYNFMKTVDELVAFSATIEGQGVEDHQNCTYTTAELRALANELVKLPKGSTVMEIGVYGGRSASLFFQLQKDLKLHIHLIDTWGWDSVRGLATFTKLVLDNFMDVPFTLYRMASEQASYVTTEGDFYFDFLHIDGWHDMPGIDTDCRMWLPWLLPNGVVAFHDSDCPPVAECIDKYCGMWTLIDRAGRTTVWRKPSA